MNNKQAFFFQDPKIPKSPQIKTKMKKPIKLLIIVYNFSSQNN